MKEIIWVSSSKKDLLALSEEIRDEMGYGLYMAQLGQQHKKAKPLKGFGGAGVLEIIDSDEAGTYRTVYTITMPKAVCVLHVFQKKSKQGIKTAKLDIDLIKNRLKQAREIYQERYKYEKE